MSGQSPERVAQETKGPVIDRHGHRRGAGPGQVNAPEGGTDKGVGTRRGSALPPTGPPPLSIISPEEAHSSAPPLSLPLSASPEMANPQRFLGSSLVAWHGLSLPISQPWHLSLMFRTRQADGVLLQAVTRGRSTITLQVTHGGRHGEVGPGGGCCSLQGAGLRWIFPGNEKAGDQFGGSLLPSVGPEGNNTLSSGLSRAAGWVFPSRKGDRGLEKSWSRWSDDPPVFPPSPSCGRAMSC